MEIKHKQTVTRGEEGEANGGRRGRVKLRDMYKGPIDKDNGGMIEGGR